MFEFFTSLLIGTGLLHSVNPDVLTSVTIHRPPQERTFRDIPQIEATSYLLGDVESGQILLQSHIDEPRAIASLTKLMTVVVALETYGWSAMLDVSRAATQVAGTRIPLLAGDRLALRDVALLAMVRSGNDAAWTLASNMVGGVSAFVEAMNQKAQDLGMFGTVFVNPTGLDDMGQVSTARDLFALTRYIVAVHPEILDMASRSQVTVQGQRQSYQVMSTNLLLASDFLQMEGLKTGTTEMAGQSYIGMVRSQGGRRYAIVLLGSPDRFQEAKNALWWVTQRLE